MAKGGKRFIDKSKARTFTVVHRSQRDPLYADADAPQHVLAETGRGRNRSRRPANEYGDDDDDDEFEYGSGHYYGEDGEDDDELFDEADMKHMTLDDLEDDMDGDDLMEQIRGAETSLVEVPIAHKSALKEKGKSSAKKKLSIAYFDDEADKDGDEDEDEEEEEDGSNSKGGRRHVRFSLPSDVLPSKRENRSAAANQDDFPRGLMLDLDPEVRETLEKLSDDDCEEGELDDEFIKMLGEDNDEVVEEYRVRSGNVRVEPARSAYDYGEEDEEDDLADFRAWRNRGSRRRSSDDEYDSEDDGSMGSFGSDDREFDRRTVGSAFSMSSSVMYRNEKLSMLDEQFDEIEKEYMDDSDDDDDDDDYDDDDMDEETAAYKAQLERRERPLYVEGGARPDFEEILDEYLNKYEIAGRKFVPRLGGSGEHQLEIIRKTLAHDGETLTGIKAIQAKANGQIEETTGKKHELIERIKAQYGNGTEREQFEMVEVSDGEGGGDIDDKWDCETVLTTLTNLENHPQMIKPGSNVVRIKIDPRTGMPKVVSKRSRAPRRSSRHGTDADADADEAGTGADGQSNGMAAAAPERNDNEDDDDDENEEESPVNLGAARNRKETAEEKKARKQAVKAERRDRRADKKQLKAEHQILGMARKQVAAQRAADSIGKIN